MASKSIDESLFDADFLNKNHVRWLYLSKFPYYSKNVLTRRTNEKLEIYEYTFMKSRRLRECDKYFLALGDVILVGAFSSLDGINMDEDYKLHVPPKPTHLFFSKKGSEKYGHVMAKFIQNGEEKKKCYTARSDNLDEWTPKSEDMEFVCTIHNESNGIKYKNFNTNHPHIGHHLEPMLMTPRHYEPEVPKPSIDNISQLNIKETSYWEKYSFPPVPKVTICGFCKKNNVTQKCSKCKKMYYCGVECQKKHWKYHKKNCQ